MVESILERFWTHSNQGTVQLTSGNGSAPPLEARVVEHTAHLPQYPSTDPRGYAYVVRVSKVNGQYPSVERVLQDAKSVSGLRGPFLDRFRTDPARVVSILQG